MNMNDPIASLLGSWATELNLYSVLLRVAVSVVFAAMIGCERASKRHAAGQRTFILVSLASTMAMLLDQSVERAGGPLVSAETEEKGLDAEKAKQICVALLLYAHGMAAMQATGRTAFTRQQIETNMHAMHEMLLAQTK